MTEMSQWIDKVYIPTLFIALIVYHTDAYSSVTLDDVNCDSRVIYVSTQQSQRVEWKGTVIPKRCRVGFEATESPHAVCVDVEVFRDYKCTFTVKVYTEFSDSAIRTYDCDSTGTAKERCFDNKMIYLGFTFNTTGRSVNPSVKIEVKNKVDEDGSHEELNLPAIIISLFCFLCFLSFMFNKKLKEYLRDPCENICIPLLKVVTCPCCFLKEQCENCVTSIDTSGCRKVVSDCLARCHEQEATTTASTNVATETVTQQEDFDDVITVDLGHPSAAPTDNGWAPPPYQPPPPDSTCPEAPPPSYYDVVTGNISVSNA